MTTPTDYVRFISDILFWTVIPLTIIITVIVLMVRVNRALINSLRDISSNYRQVLVSVKDMQASHTHLINHMMDVHKARVDTQDQVLAMYRAALDLPVSRIRAQAAAKTYWRPTHTDIPDQPRHPDTTGPAETPDTEESDPA